MGAKSKIEWTDATWNPVTGCSKVSAGCKNCYAEGVAKRFWADRKFTDIETHFEILGKPLNWRNPKRIFVNSMSDLFHERVPFKFIDDVFTTMYLAKHHTFQILTKRPERMLEYIQGRTFQAMSAAGKPALVLPNVWLGVSVEDQESADERIPLLIQTPAAVRFLSAEPLLGKLDINGYLKCKLPGVDMKKLYPANEAGIGWVICGGESGAAARPFDIRWGHFLRDQCQAAGVPFFMKQFGSKPFESPKHAGATGCELVLENRNGVDMKEWPADLRVRQFPK